MLRRIFFFQALVRCGSQIFSRLESCFNTELPLYVQSPIAIQNCFSRTADLSGHYCHKENAACRGRRAALAFLKKRKLFTLKYDRGVSAFFIFWRREFYPAALNKETGL